MCYVNIRRIQLRIPSSRQAKKWTPRVAVRRHRCIFEIPLLSNFDDSGFLVDWLLPHAVREVTSCQRFVQVPDVRRFRHRIPALRGINRFSVAWSIQLMHFFFPAAVYELQKTNRVHVTGIPRITESAPALSVSKSDVFRSCRHRALKSATGIAGQQPCECFGPVTRHIQDRPLNRNISYEVECSALL